MNTQLSDVAPLYAMGHGQRITAAVLRVVKVNRPFNRSETDEKYGWFRQLVSLEGADGKGITLQIYDVGMHLKPENTGQVWRFRSLNGDNGPTGFEVRKWTPRGSDEVMIELVLHKSGDLSRLPFLEGAPEEPPFLKGAPSEEPKKEPAPVEKPKSLPEPKPKPTPTPKKDTVKAEPKPNPDEIEELVRADIARRRDFGREKYGTTMERTDLDTLDWLQHRYEEILDDAVYTRRVIRDLSEGRLVLVPADELTRLKDRVMAIDAGEVLAKPSYDELKALAEQKAEASVPRGTNNAVCNEPPVEKPARSTKNPQGSDPCAGSRSERGTPETATTTLPEELRGPGGEKLTPPAPADGTFESKKDCIKWVAANLRYAYVDGIDPRLTERGNQALRFFKIGKLTWDEVYDYLTNKEARENPGRLEKAFNAMFKRWCEERGDGKVTTREMLVEMICKQPHSLRNILNDMEAAEGV